MSIKAHSYICPKGAWLNGNKLVSCEPDDHHFLKAIYGKMGLEYPKFHKMDVLAKQAFLASELLFPELESFQQLDNSLQLIFANRFSSEDTDLKFQKSYLADGSPSPSLFVYTLPNILTGELAIRHKWYGENCFFIQEAFNPELFAEQLLFAFEKGNEFCLCGWVEYTQDIRFALLFFVDKELNAEGIPVSADEILTLYQLYNHE